MVDLNPLTYGTVTGRFLAIVADAGDALENPDYVPLVGTVTLTPDLPYGLVLNASPVPATIIPRPIVVTLDVDGQIEWNGLDSINLLATDDPNVNPTDFTYTASFNLSIDGVTVPYGPFSFQLPGGTTVDLTTVAPVASAGGVLTIAGPPGPPGSVMTAASAAEAQAMSTNTKTITPANLADVSTTAATASRIVLRDASGRAQVASPSASADIATKGYVDPGLMKDYGTGTTLIDAVETNEVGWVTITNDATLYSPLFGSSVTGLVVSQLSDIGADGEFASDAELFQTFHGVADYTAIPYHIVRKRTRTGGVWGAFGAWRVSEIAWEPSTGNTGERRIASTTDLTSTTASAAGAWLELVSDPMKSVPLSGTGIKVASVQAVEVGDIIGLGLESGSIFAQDNAAPTTLGAVPAATITGTGTNFDVTSRTGADRATRFARYDYIAASASTTAVAGVTYPLALTRENGFIIRFRFAVTSGITSNTRLFAGLIDSASMSDVEPDTLLSMVGIGYKSADTNFTWYSNDATLGTAGATASTTAVSTTPSQVVDCIIRQQAGSSLITATARINTAGTVTTTTYSASSASVLPATSSPLFFMLRASAGGTSAQPGISLLGLQYTTGMF